MENFVWGIVVIIRLVRCQVLSLRGMDNEIIWSIKINGDPLLLHTHYKCLKQLVNHVKNLSSTDIEYVDMSDLSISR